MLIRLKVQTGPDPHDRTRSNHRPVLPSSVYYPPATSRNLESDCKQKLFRQTSALLASGWKLRDRGDRKQDRKESCKTAAE